VKIVRSRDGDTVSQILWLALKRNDDDTEEALYDLNPNLEQYGPVLPAGIEIVLPELSTPTSVKVVNIWN